jgi:hypothetical protein
MLTTFGVACVVSQRWTGTIASEARHRTHLVVAYIVITLVHALPIRPARERFRDVLDIRDPIDERTNWPVNVALGNPVQIN